MRFYLRCYMRCIPVSMRVLAVVLCHGVVSCDDTGGHSGGLMRVYAGRKAGVFRWVNLWITCGGGGGIYAASTGFFIWLHVTIKCVFNPSLSPPLSFRYPLRTFNAHLILRLILRCAIGLPCAQSMLWLSIACIIHALTLGCYGQ